MKKIVFCGMLFYAAVNIAGYNDPKNFKKIVTSAFTSTWQKGTWRTKTGLTLGGGSILGVVSGFLVRRIPLRNKLWKIAALSAVAGALIAQPPVED